jgi:hypothetical protein
VTFNPVFKEFLSTCVSKRVRFLVVGAHALAAHGRPRYTEDLDVWVEPTATNARRVVEALRDFGFPSYALHLREFMTEDRMTHLGSAPLRIDVMTSISGVTFQAAWRRRLRAKVDDLPLSFLGRADLVTNKAASARPKDLADLALLAELGPQRRARTVAAKRKAASRRRGRRRR